MIAVAWHATYDRESKFLVGINVSALSSPLVLAKAVAKLIETKAVETQTPITLLTTC